MKAIERGITVSDLGLTPNNDGKIIRLNIPQLTAVRAHTAPGEIIMHIEHPFPSQ